MEVTRRLQFAVKRYKHGPDSMASAMFLRSGKALLAKVDPGRDDTHVSPEEMQQIMEMTGDFGALYELASQCDHACLRNPTPNAYAGEDCRASIVDTLSKAAEFVKKAIEADADGNVTSYEAADVAKACIDLMAAANNARAFIAWRHEQCKPPHLRKPSSLDLID